jgi:predicted ATP-dependent serine protease
MTENEKDVRPPLDVVMAAALEECCGDEALEDESLTRQTLKPARIKRVQDLPKYWDYDGKVDWLVADLIPEACVVLLSGESGIGKSTLSLQLAHAVATGTPFLGNQTVQRSALIVDQENSRAIYCQRFARCEFDKAEHLHVWGPWINEPPGPESPIVGEFAKTNHGLIVFDSLVAFHPGSEQDATETRRFMQGFRQLTTLGATVVLIHHTGKGENTKQYRGSSDIKASVDTALLLKKEERRRAYELEPFKSREGLIEPVQMMLEDTGFYAIADRNRKAVEGYVQEHPWSNQTQIRAGLEGAVPEGKITDVLERGLAAGRLEHRRGRNNSHEYRVAGG